MASTGSFAENDRKAAANFAEAARDAGVRRIIYLGGLGEGTNLSAHLSSRQEVGEVLRTTGVQVIELRGVDRYWLRQPLLRDDPRTGRPAAGHDHAAMGADPGSTDRH